MRIAYYGQMKTDSTNVFSQFFKLMCWIYVSRLSIYVDARVHRFRPSNRQVVTFINKLLFHPFRLLSPPDPPIDSCSIFGNFKIDFHHINSYYYYFFFFFFFFSFSHFVSGTAVNFTISACASAYIRSLCWISKFVWIRNNTSNKRMVGEFFRWNVTS